MLFANKFIQLEFIINFIVDNIKLKPFKVVDIHLWDLLWIIFETRRFWNICN